jgi:hypothetical protein
MAGQSRRFREAGFAVPKYELPVGDRPAFDYAVLGFRSLFASDTFHFICRDDLHAAPFVEQRLAAIGVRDATIYSLPTTTTGQAHTVLLGINHLGLADNASLTIFNIDTFRPAFDMPNDQTIASADGYLETFLGSGDHWSFVEPVAPGSSRARRVTEKVRNSPYCSTGLYHFRRAADFRFAYERDALRPSVAERYVAPLYQHLIDRGQDIRFTLVPADAVFFCGTPLEYQALLGQLDRLQKAFGQQGG